MFSLTLAIGPAGVNNFRGMRWTKGDSIGYDARTMSTLLALILWTLPMAGNTRPARPTPAPRAAVRGTIPAADVFARRPSREVAPREYLLLAESTDDQEEESSDIEDPAADFQIPLVLTLFRNGIAVEPAQHLLLDPPCLRTATLRC
jgi:hypothetical protein